MSVVDDLKAAKRWLSRPSRWTKGSFYGGDDRFNARCACVMGACAIAAGGTAPSTNYGKMLSALDDVLPDSDQNIANFNDNTSTTFDDVHALFDRAIARQETANA